ncbi:MAG: Uma2 family endonuclease [Acidobacteriota bacterium]
MRQLEAALEAEALKRQYFYDVVSDQQTAEFINGEVIVQSPVKESHSEASENLFTLLKMHVRQNELGIVHHEKALVTLTRNDYEPDICFFGNEKASHITPSQMKYPAPDFVVEVISDSTELADRGVKFEDYAAHGVREYWIVDAVRQTVEQYLLEEGVYKLSIKASAGMIASVAVMGFEIPVRAIFDPSEQLAALRTIVAR